MRYLLVLFSVLLTASAASAQTEKPTPVTPPVTKLPGEENLSVQERAERDFLMPVRRKQVAAEAPAAPAAATDNITAAPEQDAVAQHMELALAAREEALPAALAPVREARAVRHHSSTRRHVASSSKSSKSTHSSKSGKSSKSSKAKSGKHSTSTKKKTSHSSVKKTSAKKSTSSKKKTTGRKGRR